MSTGQMSTGQMSTGQMSGGQDRESRFGNGRTTDGLEGPIVEITEV